MTVIVPPAGRTPNLVLLVGEAPGREEAAIGEPFVGRSGQEQDAYLAKWGLSPKFWRRTNVVPVFTPGNPDPTAAQIREWTPTLEREVVECAPELIIAVGRFAARWFLGDCTIDEVHGVPHWGGAFDPSIAHRARGAVVLPITHPAAGFYDGDARAVIAWDYSRVAAVLKEMDEIDRVTGAGSGHIHIAHDEYASKERYFDVDGTHFAFLLATADKQGAIDVLGLDTEGYTHSPWSIQVSITPGQAFVLRRTQEDFDIGIRALQKLIDRGTLLVIHNAMHDLSVCRALGLDMGNARIWDSMYASYLLRIEPQGLKPLAWRWCGMRMQSYRETVGPAALERQLDYLGEVIARAKEWPKPEPRLEEQNDGTDKVKTPQRISQAAERAVVDYYSEKVNKDGERTDPAERWKNTDPVQRSAVEAVLGKFPVESLDDIPLERAVHYAARDADACVRLYPNLKSELARLDIS